MPDQKLKIEAEDVTWCYRWAQQELGKDFERTMCDICIAVLNSQAKAHEEVGFTDIAVFLALPDESESDDDNEYHRRMMMAVVGWNILENDGIFL